MTQEQTDRLPSHKVPYPTPQRYSHQLTQPVCNIMMADDYLLMSHETISVQQDSALASFSSYCFGTKGQQQVSLAGAVVP